MTGDVGFHEMETRPTRLFGIDLGRTEYLMTIDGKTTAIPKATWHELRAKDAFERAKGR